MAYGPPRRAHLRRARHGVLDTVMEGVGDLAQSFAVGVVPGVVDSLDIDELVRRVDIEGLLGQIDFDALLERIDVERLVQRVDLDATIARVDLDAILASIDINGLLARTEIGELASRSGTAIARRSVDQVRSQCVGLDAFIDRWVGRLLRRHAAAPATVDAARST